MGDFLPQQFQSEIEDLEGKMKTLFEEWDADPRTTSRFNDCVERRSYRISATRCRRVLSESSLDHYPHVANLGFLFSDEGMREGEIAELYARIEKNEDDLSFFEPSPGSAARPSSPYFNDIDYSAKTMNKELVELENDLQVKMRYSERMQTLVSSAANLAKRRVEREAANRPVTCLSRMNALKPNQMMNILRKEHQSRRFHAGVPRAFRVCHIVDERLVKLMSECHHGFEDAREEAIVKKKEQLDSQIMEYYFCKRDCDISDEQCGKEKSSLSGGTMLDSGCGAECLDQIFYSSETTCDLTARAHILAAGWAQRAPAHFAPSDLRASVRDEVAEVAGGVEVMVCSTSGRDGTALPQETLEFVLELVYFLHEFHVEQVRCLTSLAA
eukprot:764635-Hanusia_phi.AAC.7